MKTHNLISFLLISVITILLYSCNSKPQWGEYRGGTHFVVGVESKGNVETDSKNVKIMADSMKERLKQFGIKKSIVKIIENNQIAIQIPPVENAKLLVKIVAQSFVLELRLIDDSIKAQEFEPNKNQATREILYEIKTDPRTGQKNKIPYVTETENVLQIGEYVKYVEAKKENAGIQYYVILILTDQGANIFEEFTANHIKRRLAIVLDDRIYSAPIIREKISGGRIQIAGNFSKEEASDLKIVLVAGSSPAHTKLIEFKELTKDCWLGSSQ